MTISKLSLFPQRCTYIAVLLALATACCAVASPHRARNARLPNSVTWADLMAHASNISVPSSTLFDLFLQHHNATTTTTVPDPPTPLPSWVKIGKVRADATFEDGDHARTTMTFPVRVLRSPGDTTSQTSEIDLIPTQYTLINQNVSVTTGTCKPEFQANARYYTLLIPAASGSCESEVTLEVVMKIKKDAAARRWIQNQLFVPLPKFNFGAEVHASIPHTVGTYVHRAVWAIKARSPAIRRSVQVDDVKNATSVTAVTGANVDGVQLQWSSSTILGLKAETETSEGEEDLSTRLEFSSTHFVQSMIATGYVSTTETFQYEVTSGELPEVSLHVPKNVRVGDVFGDVDSWNIRNDTSDPSQQVLFVRRSNPSSPTMYIGVRTEMDVDTTHSKFKFQPLRTIGPRREQGYISFYRSSSLDVKLGGLDRVARIDPTEAPRNATSSASQRGKNLAGVFKFSHSEFSLEVEVIRHSDVPIVTCVAEQADFELLTSPQGTVFKSRIVVANMDMDWLHVHLQHKNYDLWSVHVDGEPVKPVSDSPGHILVPLNRRTDASTEGVKQQVEITHFAPEIAVNATFGDHQISALLPTLEVPILELFASISVPATEKYTNFEDESESLSSSFCHDERAQRIKDTTRQYLTKQSSKSKVRASQGHHSHAHHQQFHHQQARRHGGHFGRNKQAETLQTGFAEAGAKDEDEDGESVSFTQGGRARSDQGHYQMEYGAYIENGTLPVKIEVRRPTTQMREFCVSAALTMPKEQGEEIVLTYTTVNTRDWQYKAKIFLKRHGRDIAIAVFYIIALSVAIKVLKSTAGHVNVWLNQLAANGPPRKTPTDGGAGSGESNTASTEGEAGTGVAQQAGDENQ